jgi:hypothetical protein
MAYRFLDHRPTPDGRGVLPDCPEGIGFVLLADLPGVPWALFDIAADDAWAKEHAVREDLAALIESGKRYPPALALARQEVRQVFGDHAPSHAEFQRAYGAALRNYLSRQHESPYLLAPSLKDEAGRLVRGEWYWVLEISGSPPRAAWVSDDFHVHEAKITDFDLTGQQLKRLGYSG